MTATWLDEIPKSWVTVPFGSIFSHRKEKNIRLQRDEVLSVVKDKGVIPYAEKGNVGNKVSEDLSGYKLVDVGDFVLNSMNLFMGSVGVSRFRGVTSTAYIVCRPSPDVHGGYFGYLIRCRGFQEHVGLLGKGIMEIREAVRWSSLKSVRVPVPDVGLQASIATFLDRETAVLDQLIQKKQQFIKLLKEHGEALITNAITVGSYPAEHLKLGKSGFLKHLPAHWTEERLRFSIRRIEQGWSPSAEQRLVVGEEWGVLKVGCVNGGRFRPEEHKALSSETTPRPELQIAPGDLLMSRGNSLELVGSAAIVKQWLPRLMLSDLVYRLTLDRRRAAPEFVALVLNSRPLRRQIELCASGSSDTMPKINQEKIRSLVWARPPLEEQARIAQQILNESAKSEVVINRCQLSIDRISELKGSLVTAAVTGQLDIAKWRKRGMTERLMDSLEVGPPA
jgi:type I restriction enzyme S subunit